MRNSIRKNKSIKSCYTMARKRKILHSNLINASKDETLKTLILEFHKVFRNVPTNELDSFIDSVIEKSKVAGSMSEKIILDILAIEKKFREEEEIEVGIIC